MKLLSWKRSEPRSLLIKVKRRVKVQVPATKKGSPEKEKKECEKWEEGGEGERSEGWHNEGLGKKERTLSIIEKKK